MMLRASEAKAPYEGITQKGFGVSSIDGSPFLLGLKATNETHRDPKISLGEVEAPDATRLKILWIKRQIKRQSNPKQINISDNQQPSGDKQEYGSSYKVVGSCLLRASIWGCLSNNRSP
jgi:hypothetical protein